MTPKTAKQYNGEDIFCKDGYNMVTTLKLKKVIFITGYKKDLLNKVWVTEWVITRCNKL